MRILLVEDEPKTSAFLKQGLTEQGFVVDSRDDGEAGLAAARTGDFDLLILDVMLPKRDGWSILEELRRQRIDVPVLFLTARDGVGDRVRGLELGADDYLVKPFAFSELLARVRSILRRTISGSVKVIRIADLEIDFLRDRAQRCGQKLDLTPKEFAMLTLLARHQGESITRDFIAQQVWDMPHDGATNVVDVHVRRLRAKVDDPFEHKLIHTVRGVGYLMEDRR